jgi:hypothetical protein
VAGGVLVESCAINAELPANRLTAISAAMNNVFVDFIRFCCTFWLFQSAAPSWNGGMSGQTHKMAEGYNRRKTLAAD